MFSLFFYEIEVEIIRSASRVKPATNNSNTKNENKKKLFE